MKSTQKVVYLCAVSFVSMILASLCVRFSGTVSLFIPATLLMCISSGCFALSYMLSSTKLFAITIPASVICAFFITMDPAFAVLSLVPFATGLIIAARARKKAPKTDAVVWCDLATAAIIAVAWVVSQLVTTGTLKFDEIINAYNEYFENARETMTNALNASGLFETYSNILRNIDMSNYTQETFYAEIVNSAVVLLKAIVPALIIVLLNIVSYLNVRCFEWAARISGTDIAIPNGKWYIVPSSISCYLFVLSVFVYLIAGLFSFTEGYSVVEIVTMNIILILLLPLFICGIRGTVGRMKSPERHRMGVIRLVVTIVVFILNFAYGFVFVALEGSWDLISYYRSVKQWRSGNSAGE